MYIDTVMQWSPDPSPELVPNCKWNLCPLNADCPRHLPPAAGDWVATMALSSSTLLGSLWKWDYAVFVICLWWVSLSMMSSRLIHIVASVRISLLFNEHSMEWHSVVYTDCILFSIHPLMAFVLFLPPGSYESCCEHGCTGVHRCLSHCSCVLHLEVEFMDLILIVCLIFWGTTILFLQ